MEEFHIRTLKKKKISNPILIEGLPGIGNVGKVAVDFVVETFKAQKIMEIYSKRFPHSVFINEKNLIELPIIEIYHKKINKQDFLFLAGDIQPIDEHSCYEFSDKILDWFVSLKGKEIVTLGGIGLQKIPKRPKVFVTGNNWDYVKTFRGASNKIHGVVGPIVGVTGVLLGLAQLRDIKAASLLAQAFVHPSYLGIKGARGSLKILNNKFNWKLDLSKMDDEIAEIEAEIKAKTKQIMDLRIAEKNKGKELSYFG
ncbi:MAG: PAC2 family protein [Nanoarchaeota archaeon]|nr:PAC2 family protein [Nanoarchaeota archaeon]